MLFHISLEQNHMACHFHQVPKVRITTKKILVVVFCVCSDYLLILRTGIELIVPYLRNDHIDYYPTEFLLLVLNVEFKPNN